MTDVPGREVESMAPQGRQSGAGSFQVAEKAADADGALPIGAFALPDEDQADHRVLLEQWKAAYQPASAIECDLVELIVGDLMGIRRCRRQQHSLEARLGLAAVPLDSDRVGILTARRRHEQTFHSNYKLLLEMRKRPVPQA
jgi:hypothetical protein